MPYLPLARQSADAPYNGERLLNLFARPSGATSPVVLMGRSGLTDAVSLGGPVRAMGVSKQFIYAVAAGRLWRWNGAGTATSLGVIPDDPGAEIAVSTGEVAVAANGALYLWNGSALSMPTPGAITRVQGVVHLNNYFIAYGDAEGRGDGFQVSGVNDGSTWDALDILFAQGDPDEALSVKVFADRLVILGRGSIEFFYDAGAATGVFRRDGTPLVEIGIETAGAAAVDITGIYWVASDGRAYRTEGVAPRIISTPEIAEKLPTVTRAFVAVDRGHKFVAFWRPNAPALCYDVDTGLWHERNTGLSEGPWIARAAAMFKGAQYFGTDTGIAVASAASYSTTTPQIAMQQSSGGGVWGNERLRSLGADGDYSREIAWNGLGAGRRKQFRFRVTDNGDDNGTTFVREAITPPIERGGGDFGIGRLVLEAATGRAQIDLHGVSYG